jgi:hypothetical protein
MTRLSYDAKGAIEAAARVIEDKLAVDKPKARQVAQAALEAALPHLINLAAPHRMEKH